MGQVSASMQNVLCGTDGKETGLMILHCVFVSLDPQGVFT